MEFEGLGSSRPDVCDLSRYLAERRLTPSGILSHYLNRIQQLNPALNAIVALNPTAEADAVASDKRRDAGKHLSPIDGISVLIKDNLVAKNMPCSWGSKAFKEYVPNADELPIERLRASGAVILGKTNVPEFTLEGYCGNDLHGVTKNPWNISLTPGGSSGGSVAAVAAGLAPFALGTDGGGSIRRPAAYTGLVGLKPSIGRIPRDAGLPQLLLDFEVVGPLTRTVRDARLIYDLLAGQHVRDHRSALFAKEEISKSKPLNILYVERFGDAPLDPFIAQSVGAAVNHIGDLGHTITLGELPFDIAPVNAFWPSIGQFSLAKLLSDFPDIERSAASKYLEMARQGQSLTASVVHQGLETVWALRDAVGAVFEHIDVIITPSCAAMPWPASESFPEVIDGKSVGPRGHAVYTGWVNACGHPAISLPSSPSRSGMPIGFQMIAGFGHESLLLDLAADFEQARPWAHRWPDVTMENSK